jgi:hypothetical protein
MIMQKHKHSLKPDQKDNLIADFLLKSMKTTQYFDYVKKRPDRAYIKEKWIKFVIKNPERTEIQSDGRIRKWAKIDDVDRFLRVILLEDGETVHNAFFDRSFKED